MKTDNTRKLIDKTQYSNLPKLQIIQVITKKTTKKNTNLAQKLKIMSQKKKLLMEKEFMLQHTKIKNSQIYSIKFNIKTLYFKKKTQNL